MSDSLLQQIAVNDNLELTQETAYVLLDALYEKLKDLEPQQFAYCESFRSVQFLLFELYESIHVKKDYVDAWGIISEIDNRCNILSSNILPTLCKALSTSEED